MVICKNIYTKLLNMPIVPPEHGGIIGGRNEIITHFAFDVGISSMNYDSYIPNTEYLNEIIRIWQNTNIKFYGIVHTHRINADSFSNGDKDYIEAILNAHSFIKQLYFPIIIPNNKIICYKAHIKSSILIIEKEDLYII